MNLFILHSDPIVSAEMNCDKHVCKIILEAIQMMCLAHLECGNAAAHLWNAKTHRNNHVSKWVRENISNYNWTAKHGLALCDQYTIRYHKIHGSYTLMKWCADNPPSVDTGPMTPFRQAIPDDCKQPDTIEAYRDYYVRYKSRFARWRLGNIPPWYVSRLMTTDPSLYSSDL